MTKAGISNRLSGDEEEPRDRAQHPPQPTGPPPPEDAAGRVGDADQDNLTGAQTSHKAGSRSVAQKEAESKYADRSMPQTHEVPGASGTKPPANGDPD